MRLLKRRWQEVGKGRFIGPSQDRVAVDAILDAVVTNYKVEGYRSLQTLEGRIKHLRDAFGGMRAVDVSEALIEKYKEDRLKDTTKNGGRPVQRATVNRELCVLRRAFRLAVKQKRIGAAPDFELLEENPPRSGFVEPEAFAAIANTLPEEYRDFARFAYICGWRKNEVQRQEWVNVNYEARRIILPPGFSKNKEARPLPLAGELAEIIERRLQARVIRNSDGSTKFVQYVFHRGDGRPVGDFRKAWVAACKKAAAERDRPELARLLFHDLRRSAVRNLDRHGVSQAVGMLISGHKTAGVYRRYRITPERDIAEALERLQQGNTQEAKQKEARVLAMAKKAGP